MNKPETQSGGSLNPVGSSECIHYVDKLPYRARHEDAEKRHKAGEHQKRCPVCLKWIWESYWPNNKLSHGGEL